jgi:hypothetical protein
MAVLPDPFYYLENFRRVLAWVGERHADLLADDEQALVARIDRLPRAAQALLVRLVMRKGELFRESKLAYAEIGATAPAAAELVAQGLVEADPALALDEVFALLRRDELQDVCAALLGEHLTATGLRALKTLRKDALLATLQAQFPDARALAAWHPDWREPVYRLRHAAPSDLLRLLFFGNLHQDWSEFVLTDLGLLRYETVAIPAESRAFQCRADVDTYRELHALRMRLEDGEAPAAVFAVVPAAHANPWLEERRGKLLFHIGQQLEREKDWPAALAAYRAGAWPEARLRAVRVLEQDGQAQAAFELAQAILAEAPREEERQQLARTLPRLQRKLGLPRSAPEVLQEPAPELLVLPPHPDLGVEWIVQAHLHRDDAPVFYVENALINSLFGLLCWEAVFAPVPGAFFHAYHYGPADLHHPGFSARRADVLARCLARLDSGDYRDAILATWRARQGVQSPFVFWDVLDEEMLALALDCIPPAHLRALFTRLLGDIKNNRSGFPDLVQFWPAEKRYRMLEVKGPGDRLQDNQRRWLDYCIRHGIPVAVAHVAWTEEA